MVSGLIVVGGLVGAVGLAFRIAGWCCMLARS